VVDSKDIIVEQDGNVLCITLNRPDVLNAFSSQMRQGIFEALTLAKNNKEIRAVLLMGAGSSFCAGGDVKRMGNFTPQSVFEHLSLSKELILAMTELDVPIITAIHGYVAGGGTGLALASDIILAAGDSKFYFSFAKLGLVPDTSVMFFLPRTLGLYRAKEIIFNPRPIDAKTALEWGIVNHLYPAEQIHAEAKKFAQKIAKGPSRALGHMKRIANRALVSDLSDVLEMEATAQAIMVTTEDHQEGVRAFKEKQKPSFVGK
jgi:2-(1,2-epoxy-1,2-dihydrophenyl)acetyl-CoA isomerase